MTSGRAHTGPGSHLDSPGRTSGPGAFKPAADLA
jgi:hypothetical protein